MSQESWGSCYYLRNSLDSPHLFAAPPPPRPPPDLGGSARGGGSGAGEEEAEAELLDGGVGAGGVGGEWAGNSKNNIFELDG